jgi:hypothetical protein
MSILQMETKPPAPGPAAPQQQNQVYTQAPDGIGLSLDPLALFHESHTTGSYVPSHAW